MQDLDPLQRDAVTLVYFDGRTPSEAARILGIAPRDVASALARAFRHVASWLADESPVEVLHEEPF